MNETITQTDKDPEQGELALLQTVFVALSKYTWGIPVAFGVPGNILSIFVANRRHNRKLSPSVYMTAMAVVDTIFLLEATWFYSLFYPGYLDRVIVRNVRGFVAMYVYTQYCMYILYVYIVFE
jgi:hypothetical protein